MSKKLTLIKKFKKLLLSINLRIESFFNTIKILLGSKKKIKDNLRIINKKILISIATIFVLILSYFLIPSFYDKDLIKAKFTDQIFKRYNLKVKFEGPIEYGFLPKPYFFFKNTKIVYDKEILAKIDFTKIYINSNNFFSLDKIKIQDIYFKKTEFNINKKNFNFFEKVLNSNNSNHSINFNNSKLFYRDQNEDIIFLTNVKKLNFSINKELNKELNTNLKIFNVPIKIKVINNPFKKNYQIYLDAHKLRVNIENNLDYRNEKINGLLNFKIINKLKKIIYNIDNNSLVFKTEEDNFKGKIDFKPFYLISDINFYQLNISKLFKSNSIFFDLLNTDIMNNQSLNAMVNINFEKIKNANYIKDIFFKTYFEEGNIIIKDSSLTWKDSVLINLNDVQLIREINKISFVGVINLDFKDIDNFYKQYQIKKVYRKKIKKIQLDFYLDLTENQVQFDNIKIDGNDDKNSNDFLNDLNSRKLNFFNKVIFKNSIKEFFGSI